MSTKFYIHHKGQQLGPWPKLEVLKKLEGKEIFWTDYIYDVSKKDWILILDHTEFSLEFLKWSDPAPKSKSQNKSQILVPIDPKASASNHSTNQRSSAGSSKADENSQKADEWYILRDENKYGPFQYLEMIKLLQEKKIFDFDFVWRRGKMDAWVKVCDLSDFSVERIRAIRDSSNFKVDSVFFRRKHKRVKYGASILLHNNKEVWRGHSIEISSSGAGLKLSAGDIRMGQKLFLHFQAGDGVPPFNASVEIVSKKQDGNFFRYGVKFVEVSNLVQQSIKHITDKKSEKKVG